MHIFIDRIREFRGEPVYEILGKTREHKEFFVMYREWLNGKKVCRNLDYRQMAGYQAYGEPEKFQPATNWFKKTPAIVYRTPTPDDLEPVLKRFPDFKYIAKKKTEMFNKDVFRVLKMWQDFPKMEILLNMNLQKIAMDRNFFKLKEDAQKETIRYFFDHPDEHTCASTIATKYIRGAMKYNTTPYSYYEYMEARRWNECDFKLWEKLNKKGIFLGDYKRYMAILKSDFPERLNEKYWTEFKDVHEFHLRENHVNTEVRHRRELEDMEARKKKEKDFKKITRKFQKWNGIFNGLEVYIPSKIEDVEKQAEVLNQCLIDCDYIQDVIDKRCVLVFIRKLGEPIATAELTGKNWKNINQFYGNELDRDNCDPSPDAQMALNFFMDTFIRKSA